MVKIQSFFCLMFLTACSLIVSSTEVVVKDVNMNRMPDLFGELKK